MAPAPISLEEARGDLSLSVQDAARPDSPFRIGGDPDCVDGDPDGDLALEIQSTAQFRGPALLLSPAPPPHGGGAAGASGGQRRLMKHLGESAGSLLSTPTSPVPPYDEQVAEDCQAQLGSSAALDPPPDQEGVPPRRPSHGTELVSFPPAAVTWSQGDVEQQAPAPSPHGRGAAADAMAAVAAVCGVNPMDWRVSRAGGWRIFFVSLALTVVAVILFVVRRFTG